MMQIYELSEKYHNLISISLPGSHPTVEKSRGQQVNESATGSITRVVSCFWHVMSANSAWRRSGYLARDMLMEMP